MEFQRRFVVTYCDLYLCFVCGASRYAGNTSSIKMRILGAAICAFALCIAGVHYLFKMVQTLRVEQYIQAFSFLIERGSFALLAVFFYR